MPDNYKSEYKLSGHSNNLIVPDHDKSEQRRLLRITGMPARSHPYKLVIAKSLKQIIEILDMDMQYIEKQCLCRGEVGDIT